MTKKAESETKKKKRSPVNKTQPNIRKPKIRPEGCVFPDCFECPLPDCEGD